MKVAVVGGTGLTGGHVVTQLRAGGHEVAILARSRGVDLITGSGLDTALAGIDVTIDVTSLTSIKRKESVNFFITAGSNLLAAVYGLQASLGESGCKVSGGEGQRLRLARGFLRRDARLVILDEPFRGLERERRRELLRRARARWQGVTMIVISHDVSDTAEFDRVLVVDGGAIVEDGHPSVLMRTPGSRYRALADADVEVRRGMFTGTDWRRMRLDGGRLHRTDANARATDGISGADEARDAPP